jgi:hypothetical protein
MPPPSTYQPPDKHTSKPEQQGPFLLQQTHRTRHMAVPHYSPKPKWMLYMHVCAHTASQQCAQSLASTLPHTLCLCPLGTSPVICLTHKHTHTSKQPHLNSLQPPPSTRSTDHPSYPPHLTRLNHTLHPPPPKASNASA